MTTWIPVTTRAVPILLIKITLTYTKIQRNSNYNRLLNCDFRTRWQRRGKSTTRWRRRWWWWWRKPQSCLETWRRSGLFLINHKNFQSMFNPYLFLKSFFCCKTRIYTACLKEANVLRWSRMPRITKESLSTVIVEAEESVKEGSGVDSEDPGLPWESSSNEMMIT